MSASPEHASEPNPTSKVTFCRICEASCGLIADVQNGRVVKLRPDPEHVVSRGFACVKGIKYTEVHGSPDRVLTPLKRTDAGFVAIGWEQALSEIGERVRGLRAAHGDDSVGLYMGNPAAFSPPHALFASAFATGLGTRQRYTSGSQDCNNKFVAAEEMFGSPLLQTIPDIDHAECVVLVGTNPAISQFSIVNFPRAIERLKEVTRRSGRVFFVNPRRTESAKQVGEHLFIRPASDVFFFLAFAHVVLETVTVAKAIEARTIGLARLRDVVVSWTPERVADVTGIEPAVMRDLVRSYCAAKGAVLYAGTGVNQGPHGTLSTWLLNAINVVTGNIARRGGMLITEQQMRTARYGSPSGARIVHRHSRLSEHRSVLDTLPAGLLPDEVLTPGKGQLRALFVTAGNPVLSCPNSEHMKRALSELSLLVAVDLFRNETGNLAHYILPATSFLERADVPMGVAGYQPTPYVQYVEPVVQKPPGVQDEWWIFAQLGRVCGAPLYGSRLVQWFLDRSLSAASPLPRWLRFVPQLLFALIVAGERLTLRTLRKHPHGILRASPSPAAFLKKGVLTEHGKVALAPARFVASAATLPAELLLQREDCKKLRLITKRERHSHNSWMHNVAGFVAGERGENHVHVHPLDAQERGLSEGMTSELRTATGNLRARVRITDDLMVGTVALPHGWGHAEADGLTIARSTRGANVNLLAADGAQAIEGLSGMARLTGLAVELTRVSDA